MANDVRKPDIELGDFPYQSGGPEGESPYLTWIRNYSNYMAVRGPFDYLRAIGVLLRGVLVNFLIITPYLLGVALAVAASKFLQQPPPFRITKILLVLFGAWILVFPVATPLFRIVLFQKSGATGSDSSVTQRDIYERSFGAFLLAILAVAFLESLPGLVDVFRDLVHTRDFGFPTVAATVAVASAIFSFAPKLLSMLGGRVAKTLALIAIGAVGVIVPLLFVLFVSDFLVFGPPRDWTPWLKRVGPVFPSGVVLAVLLGVLFGVFQRKDFTKISVLLFVAIGLAVVARFADALVLQRFMTETAELRDEAIVELSKHPEQLEAVAVAVADHPGPRLRELNAKLEQRREYLIQKRDFFSQHPTDTADYWNEYRRYRAKRDDYLIVRGAELDSTEQLRSELLQELLEELRGAAHNVEGLSPFVRLADAVEASGVEPDMAGITEVHRLYRRVNALREMLSLQPRRTLVAGLSNFDIARLQGDREYPVLATLDEFAEAERSIDGWGNRLKTVRDELDAKRSDATNVDFFAWIDRVAESPGASLQQLIDDLAQTRAELRQRRRRLALDPADPNHSFVETLEQLTKAGHHVHGLYPSFGRLVSSIRSTQDVDTAALKPELGNLYLGAATLEHLFGANSLRVLASRLVTLPKQDIDRFYRLSSFWSSYEGYSNLQQFDEPLSDSDHQSALEATWWLGLELSSVRDELAATATLAPSGSAFYATPVAQRVRANFFWPKFIFVSMLAIQLGLFCWLTVDVNLTSIHGLYRDRLATAFLVGQNEKDDVCVEEDIDLAEICRHEAGSVAPYHLINVALNLQGSKKMDVRDRKSDFFIFSKKFIGGKCTGYCRSETMEQVFPQMDLATAMAISAAAASPNMGRGTNPALVAIMTLLNIRLGFWLPNPGLLASELKEERDDELSFDRVFHEELGEIEHRWEQVYDKGSHREFAPFDNNSLRQPSIANGLVGLAFSGGGIRSATLNLGITQALYEHGVFDHVDYMSTVSGGGYLGSSISTLMRHKVKTVSETGGVVRVQSDRHKTTVSVTQAGTSRTYEYLPYAEIAVRDGETIKAGQRLLSMGPSVSKRRSSYGKLFSWRVRPSALLREALGRLDEKHRWVNVSDGGHIENLATIELLRRKCKYIIIGDGEADPDHHFTGVATLIRTARIDLGVEITIDLGPLRLDEKGYCRHQWALGRIKYRDEEERGYLLYMKSSVTGHEDEVIQEYRHKNPDFPHESTADQFFSEGQFEAYRSLGQYIGEQVLKPNGQQVVTNKELTGSPQARPGDVSGKMSFKDLESWFARLDPRRED